ncbi:MAG: TniB family NTP-binding protein [Hyphomicrobiales bacterium]|nr:TniB family NTP-binding protein [Hyphomicrobiales bacterium]
MTEPRSHLTPAAAALLAETPERRIRAILSERWVLYPRAKQALDHLNRLVVHPRVGSHFGVRIHFEQNQCLMLSHFG